MTSNFFAHQKKITKTGPEMIENMPKNFFLYEYSNKGLYRKLMTIGIQKEIFF
jgi:hypothetical protein